MPVSNLNQTHAVQTDRERIREQLEKLKKREDHIARNVETWLLHKLNVSTGKFTGQSVLPKGFKIH